MDEIINQDKGARNTSGTQNSVSSYPDPLRGPPHNGPEDATFLQAQVWPNEAVGPPNCKTQENRDKKTSDRYGRQQTNTTNKAYEETMRQDGRDRFHDRWTTATDVTEQAPEFRQLQDALSVVAEGLQADIEYQRVKAATSSGSNPVWMATLMHMDPYTLAYIGLHSSYNAVLQQNTLSTLTQTIGKLIERECLKVDMLEGPDAETNRTNKRLVAQVSKAHTSPAVRLKALRNMATKNGFHSLYFGTAKTSKEKLALSKRRAFNAGPILSAILHYCNIFEKSTTKTKVKKSWISRTQLAFTAQAVVELEQTLEHMEWMQPLLKPMAMALPNPWTSFHTGCYDDPFLAAGVKLIRRANRGQKEAIEHDFTKGVPTYIRALNALQATPLSINEPILEALQWCWYERKHFGKFPAQDLPAYPSLPDGYEGGNLELEKTVRADQREYRNTQKQIKGSDAVMRQDLQTAHELAVHEWFGMPFNLDYRSRFYPVPSFNYHRDDHIKALFMFNRGYKVEGNNAFWLKVHLANVGDFDKTSKMPLQDRADWVDNNSEWILEIAKDYRGRFDDWTEAAKPFQFLAAAIEYLRYTEEGDDFVAYLPYSLDGTNSGVQHYSAMSLAEDEGALTNLVPSAQMSDIYQAVADKVTTKLHELTEDNSLFSAGQPDGGTVSYWAKVWLEFGITRSVEKRAVMTWPYSSKQPGMTKQFMDDLMKPLQSEVAYGLRKVHPIAADDNARFVASRFLASVSYDAIVDTLPAAGAAMRWLQATSQVLSQQNKPVRWTTPSGFPVVQDYQTTRPGEAKIFLYDRAAEKKRKRQKLTFTVQQGKTDQKQSKSGICANFVHSHDAAAMALCIVDLLDKGQSEDFMMIHDSFATSGDVWDLYHSVRHTFVEMYDDHCVFKAFQADIRRDLEHPSDLEKPKNKVPPIPAKGTLDLQGIKDSEFCFS